MAYDFLANASQTLDDILANVNQTLGFNSTISITRYEVEHFLGDTDVLHAGALVLGIVAILLAKGCRPSSL